jgi:hypothetical protein
LSAFSSRDRRRAEASSAARRSQTPITLTEVERATQLGGLLFEALGQRKQGTDGSADPREADEQLAKAYELSFRTYDECRRAALYLRWHEGDADEFAPSLQPNRRRSRAAPNDEPGDGPNLEGPWPDRARRASTGL